MHIPSPICNFLFLLFHNRYFHFFLSLTTSYNAQFTETLPEVAVLELYCLIYIISGLANRRHSCLLYANDIIIYSFNKSLAIAIQYFNNGLSLLSSCFIAFHFESSPGKSKSIIHCNAMQRKNTERIKASIN